MFLLPFDWSRPLFLGMGIAVDLSGNLAWQACATSPLTNPLARDFQMVGGDLATALKEFAAEQRPAPARGNLRETQLELVF